MPVRVRNVFFLPKASCGFEMALILTLVTNPLRSHQPTVAAHEICCKTNIAKGLRPNKKNTMRCLRIWKMWLWADERGGTRTTRGEKKHEIVRNIEYEIDMGKQKEGRKMRQ